MAADSPSLGKIITSGLVVTGFMVGAGILALPINIGPAGILPAVFGALAVWGLMTANGLILARQPYLEQHEGADLPSLFESVFGRTGKWLSAAANLLILYGLLTAYLAGVASVAVDSLKLPLPQWGAMLVYFCLATLFASFGEAVLHRGNALLMLLEWGLFATLLVLVVPHFEGVPLQARDWEFFTSGLPILVVAFNFHNVVPTICRTLNHDRKAVSAAIWLGSGIGMAMTMIWTVAVILTLPMEAANGVDIISAFKAGVPATVPLDRLIASPVFIKSSIAFAIVAMTTSYMGTSVSLTSFLRDVAGGRVKRRITLWILTFLPPLLVGIAYPDIFLKALNLVGGLGIGTLFGILPGILLARQSRPGSLGRWAGYGIVFFFAFILLVELGQQTDLIHIAPNLKYWSMEASHFRSHQ